MLKKPNRLTSKFQFNVTRKYGSRSNFGIFSATVVQPKNYQGPTKIGFVVPNTLHKRATKRNKIKRLFREALRHQINKIPDNLWITILAYPSALGKKYEEISTQINKLVQEISRPH